jgi:hypothetical protein
VISEKILLLNLDKLVKNTGWPNSYSMGQKIR